MEMLVVRYYYSHSFKFKDALVSPFPLFGGKGVIKRSDSYCTTQVIKTINLCRISETLMFGFESMLLLLIQVEPEACQCSSDSSEFMK